MDYLQAFENCRTFSRTDGSISRSDLHTLCQKYVLKFDSRLDPDPHNTRITFETFKQCIHTGYHDDFPPTSPPPPRPSSGPAHKTRASVPGYHHSRIKYVPSPQRHEIAVETDHRRTSYRDSNRTPDFPLSPEDPPRPSRSSRQTWDRVESPPPSSAHFRRPSRPRSLYGDDSDNNSGTEDVRHYTNPPITSSKKNKRHHQSTPDLQQMIGQLEKENEGLKKELRAAQNSDLQYTSLLRDNERLRQELKKQNRGSEHDIDSRTLERQVEDLRMELRKKRETIMDLKCYRKEYSNLRANYESQQRENWKLMNDIEKLRVRVVELERGALIGGRRPGDGGPDNKRSELGFNRSTLRSTYHGSGREPRSRKSKGLEMHKTSSATQVPDNHDDHPQREEQAYSRACKTHRSGTGSDVSSVGERLLVTTTPDEQSQVFMVMGQDVSKSVLPENLINDTELALIYALQNCHSVQEIIKCLVSYGVGTPTEKVQELRVRNEHFESQINHLKAKNAMLANSFENAKSNMENMYCHAQKVESNNTRLLHALKHCYQACEIYEVLMELRISDRRNPHYFPSFDCSSLESSTRSPDRDHHSSTSSSSGRPHAILRARNLLHSLDSDAQLQTFLPQRPHPPNGTDFRQTGVVWGGSSQNTGTTSGLSSMSGGIEGDITPDEIERLGHYIQALIRRKNRYTDSLVAVEGVKGLEVVKNWELVKDCLPAGHGGQIMDLEDAANAEELCKVREEKAELRSQIYMMDQEKRRMELEVSRMLLHKQKNDQLIAEQQFLLDRRRRKRDKKTKRGESQAPAHEPLATQLQSSLEREKDLVTRYDALFQFLNFHTKESHSVSEDLMEFVKDMWRQNSSLVEAFEKTKKRQLTEKKRMKQELVSLMNQIHQGGSAPTNEDT